ncbi:hypothetical protein JXQ31_09720 [candidate division KSB1 bacterium]|nr:hypothetical protein [candidate division KSB1 bacterium]
MLAKKRLIFLTIFILFIAHTVLAQTRTVVTLGGSWWNAAYTYEDEDGEELAEIGNGNSFGPYISINHGKINFGASLLFGTFPVDAFDMGFGEDIFDTDINMSRNDLNFTLGYRIHRNINLFAGTKYLKWAINLDMNDIPIETGTDFWGDPIYDYVDASIELSESGMLYGVGISGVIPLGSGGMYAFGSIAGMGGTLKSESTVEFLGESESETGEDISATLAAINLGLGYRFPSGFGINAGYRADLFSEEVEDSDEDSQPRIRVEGFIVTASYSF